MTMTNAIDARPPVWVGHVYLSVKEIPDAARWLETVGLRRIVVRDQAAVLEMRGGTHVVVRPGAAPGGTAPFDLMVDDLNAAHSAYADKGLSPSPIRQRQWQYDHDSLELMGPEGWVFTVYSSPGGKEATKPMEKFR
jgi:hypothetical protein